MLILIFTVAGGLLAALVYSVVSEVASLVMNWPAIWSGNLQPAITDLEGFLSGLFAGLPQQVNQTATDGLEKLVAWLNEMIPELLSRAGSAAGSFAFSIPSFVVALVIFVMATYFIASDYPRLRLMVTDRLSPGVRDFFGSVKRTAVAAFGGYVKAQLILSVVVFFILLAALWSSAALLGAAGLPAGGAGLYPHRGFGHRHGALGGGRPVSGAVPPRCGADGHMGRHCPVPPGGRAQGGGGPDRLSPILSLISIYVGMKIAGVAGMILGPVLCMVVINIGRLGVLDGVLSDLRLAAGDLAAILKNRPAPETEREQKQG